MALVIQENGWQERGRVALGNGRIYCFDHYSPFDNIYRVIQRTVERLKPEYKQRWNEIQCRTTDDLPFGSWPGGRVAPLAADVAEPNPELLARLDGSRSRALVAYGFVARLDRSARAARLRFARRRRSSHLLGGGELRTHPAAVSGSTGPADRRREAAVNRPARPRERCGTDHAWSGERGFESACDETVVSTRRDRSGKWLQRGNPEGTKRATEEQLLSATMRSSSQRRSSWAGDRIDPFDGHGAASARGQPEQEYDERATHEANLTPRSSFHRRTSPVTRAR
jgi:hypothetical protein